MLRIANLSKRYRTGDLALQNVTLDLPVLGLGVSRCEPRRNAR